VLLGDIVHRLSVEAEDAMAGSDMTRPSKPAERSKGGQLIPWIIACLSVAALTIVIATR
jgi:hypothetical protein